MNKKLLLILLFLGLMININLIDIKAQPYEDPFTYYTNGDDTHVLYSSIYFPVESGSSYFNMYIPFTKYSNVMEDVGNEFKSLILLYNANYQQTDQIDLSTYVNGMLNDDGYWYWDDLTIDGANLLNASYFRLEFIQTYGGHADPNYLDFFNTEFDYAFDEEVDLGGTYRVTFYIGDDIWYRGFYPSNGTPTQPITPVYDNLYFIGWYTYDNNKYEFDPIPFDDYMADDYVLQGKFQIQSPVGEEGIIDNTPSSLDHILTVTGFNNVVGKLIIYVIALIVTTALLLAVKLDGFIVIIVELVIFGLFIFLGWLPVYVIIIMSLIFGAGLIRSTSKGVV